MNRTTSQWTVSIPPLLSKKAMKLAKEESRTKSELVREALRIYMTRKELIMSAREELAKKLEEKGVRTLGDVERMVDETRGV